MARNRKRAKERRAHRPQRPPGARPGRDGLRSNGRGGHESELAATDEPVLEDEAVLEDEPVLEDGEHPLELPEDEVPAPLQHATPDAEIADAQIALGAAEASAPGPDPAPRADVGEPEPGPPAMRNDPAVEEVAAEASGRTVAAGRHPAGHRPGTGARLVNFAQGSWRELQRVQWPDRRQVMQATSVVIGFVVVAGVFLGVSDWLAGKLVNFILK